MHCGSSSSWYTTHDWETSVKAETAQMGFSREATQQSYAVAVIVVKKPAENCSCGPVLVMPCCLTVPMTFGRSQAAYDVDAGCETVAVTVVVVVVVVTALVVELEKIVAVTVVVVGAGFCSTVAVMVFVDVENTVDVAVDAVTVSVAKQFL